ncbi:MAG: hypothetical protein P9M07_05925 [Candidatus Aceula meridiana]|nr:hypothetical protein [Candidatus Aceula meridiana]
MPIFKDILSFFLEKEYIEVTPSPSSRKSIRKRVLPKIKKPVFSKRARPRSKVKAAQKSIPKPKEPKEILAGEVTHFFAKIQVAVVKAKKDIAVGDQLHFKGSSVDFIQVVKSMQIDHKDVGKAKKGEEFGLKTKKLVRVTDSCFFV